MDKKRNHDFYALINNQAGDLAFKVYDFEDIASFSQIQRLNYYSLIWIKSGKGNVIVDFNTYAYEPNHLFSFTPYQPFLFETTQATKGSIIHFHSDFFCIHKHQQEVACNGVLFNNIYESPFVKIDDLSIDSFEMLLREMKKDIENNQMAMHESILSYLKLFLIHAARLRNKQTSDFENSPSEVAFIPQKLKDLIEQKYKIEHAPKAYAKALHLSPKALAKISKKYFHKTLTELISERIIIEAKRELYLTSKSIKVIAADLGYEDEFYFSRFFKKNTSITPSQFRQTVGFAKAEKIN